MKNFIIRILIGAGLAFGGYYLITVSEGLVSKDEFTEVENMCNNGVQTTGIVRDSVLETQMTIAGAEISSFELKFDFMVEGKSYVAKKTVNDLDSQMLPVTAVWYDKTNPTSNSTEDPCEKLENFKSEKKVGNENLFFFGGLILGLLGLGIAWGSFKEMIASLFRRKK
ncbi:MAG: hypothetical protein MRZ79_19845 [Bacteroidia bacterium]|nr:hypothetical protein [Bacteroidia bacterium]